MLYGFMEGNNLKRTGILLILFGLGAISVSLLITPNFATNYISSYKNISTAGLATLQIYRFLLASLGVFLSAIGITIVFIQPKKVRDLRNWLVSKYESEKFLVVITFIVGSVIRFFHLFIVGLDSPYKYGGLFLEFANQIADNGFILPKNIPFYTNGGIPFAYPPLSFYFEAIAVHLLGISPYAVVNILPPFITILTLPTFYYLTRKAELNKWSRIIAFTLFVLMPNAFVQQIEGAGLPEAFGTFALIWFFISLYHTYKHNELINYFAVGFSWALCVVSSPGSAYASVPCFLFFSISLLLQERNLNTALRLSLAFVVALILSSPYWFSVIQHHGIGIFLDSFVGQHDGLIGTIYNSIQIFREFDFIWLLFIFIGVVISGFKKRFLLLAWFVFLIIIPRENIWMLSIPSALLGGIGFEAIVLYLKKKNIFGEMGKSLYVCVLLVILWMGIGSFRIAIINPFSSDSSLDPMIVEAMQWMQINTQPNSKVVVISEPHVQEWLPQISRRTVINIPYGSEWQPDEAASINEFGDKVNTCKELECILSLSQMIVDMNHFILFIDKVKLDNLTTDQNNNAEFDLLWENEKISIGVLSEN